MTPYYRYTLYNTTAGTKILDYAPQEWASDQAFWERSLTYWGIFRSFSSKELTFIKDSATYLKSVFDTDGTEAICTFQVEYYDTSIYQYVIQYSGIVDFSTYKYGVTNEGTYIKIQIIDNSFTNTVKTRETTDVNIRKLTDINGNAIIPYTTENKSIIIPERIDTYAATLIGYVNDVNPITETVYFYFTKREDAAIIDVVDHLTDPTTADASFFNPNYASDISLTYTITGELYGSVGNTCTLAFKRYNKDGTLKATQTIGTVTIVSSPQSIYYTGTKSFTSCEIDDHICLELSFTGSPTLIDLSADLSTSNTKIVFPDSTVYGYPIHEVFTRILQSITGESLPFYSSLLGRTDSYPVSYSSDGAMALVFIANGLLIRGFDFSDTDVALKANLKNLFDTIHSIYPICLGIETISGVQKVRIEELKYAFDDMYFLTIEGATNIIEEVANDLTFSNIKIGFSKSETAYNEVKGRFEYNAQTEYSTPIATQTNELNKLAPYRGDTNGVVGCLIKNKKLYATDDTNYDNDIFILNFIHSNWHIARDENYTTIGGVDNDTNSYNLDYQPARNIRRWGAFLRGFLEKYVTKILSFQASEKNSGAYSQRTDESAIVYEGTDVNISDLTDPFFENIYYSFDCIVTNAMITALNNYYASKPGFYYMVRFRNNENDAYQYGWIMKFESRKQDNKGLGTFKLLKVNTDYITPSALEIFTSSENYVSFLKTDNGVGNAHTVTYQIIPDEDIIITVSDSWITAVLDKINKTITIYPSSANTGALRTGTVTLSASGFTNVVVNISQQSAIQTFTSDKSSLSFASSSYGSGNKQTITLTITPDQTISQTNTISWATISINQAANTVDIYPTAANTGAERSGNLTLSVTGAEDIVISVTQAAAQVFASDITNIEWDLTQSGVSYAQIATLTITPDQTFALVSKPSWMNATLDQTNNRVTLYPTSTTTSYRTGTVVLSCPGASNISITVTQIDQS